MSSALKPRAALLACVPVVLGLVPGVAGAATPAETPLTPELTTLAEPAVAAEPEAAQAEALEMPAEGPGSLVRDGGAVVVEARFEAGAPARTAALEAAGATVLDTSAAYQTVALSVAPEDLEALAEVPGLEVVEPSLEPIFYGAEEAEEPGLAAPTAATSNGLCEGGAVTSQAMTQLNVAAARGVFGARGAGQTIGVLSDTFDTATEAIGGGAVATHAFEDEVSNDLPGVNSTCSGEQVPVRVLAAGPSGGTDEGRAMLQAIHDLAPHAELAFATAYSTELQFAHNIELLAAPVSAGGAGADVIVDDVGYFEEPFFQDGPVAVAIRHVTEAGVTYLTAAGNNNLIQGGNEFASWEREEFIDAACPGAVTPYLPGSTSRCMNFSPTAEPDTTFGITVSRESTLSVDLQWAEPWYGVEADLNAYLLDAAGDLIVKQTKRNAGSSSTQEPVELLGWKNTANHAVEVQLVIGRCAGSCNFGANAAARPRLKFALLEDGAGVSKTEYPKAEAAGITVGPTIYGHSGAAAAITLAAVNYGQSATSPVEPERYSSRGPVTHYFGPVVSASKPAAALTKPEKLEKPNVTATDCASTTFFASLAADGWHFCGTSEAAPQAAAVAALMRQAQPAATPASILAALQSSATPFSGVTRRAAVGAGLVNAEAAIAAIGGVPVDDPGSAVVGAVQETQPSQGTVATPAEPTGSGTTVTTTKQGTKASTGTSGEAAKPRARIVAHPRALERTRSSSIVGRFRFAADQSGVTFVCQVDGGARRPCGAHFRHRFGIGSHVVRVRAVASADASTSAPVSFRFRVKRVGG